MNAKKILIVEDEKPLANALNLKLSSAGYATSLVYNGDDALLKLKEEKFDLMIIDIMMPKRDGWSVLEELQTIGNTTPSFVMSNLGQEEDVAHATRLGAAAYLVKSNTPLKKVIEEVQEFFTKNKKA